MKFFLTIFILLTDLCFAHAPEQLFVEFSADKFTWTAEFRFDAGIALPEMRADRESPPPKHEWLVGLSAEEHTEMRVEAEKYIRSTYHFKWGGEPAEYHIEFPNWDTSPPVFEQRFTDTGFAYFRLICTGKIPAQASELTLKISDSNAPNIALGYMSMGAKYTDQIEKIISVQAGSSGNIWSSLGAGVVSISEAPTQVDSALSFAQLGFKHVIPKGWDHILFIIGIAIFIPLWANNKKQGSTLKQLLWLSLTFTVAHSITLALVGFNICVLSQTGTYLTELLIALTILYTGLENFLFKSVLRMRIRITVIFIFGLIHGLGFGSVLLQKFDQSRAIFTPLLSANIGIEIAQILIILLTWLFIKFLPSETIKVAAMRCLSLVIAGIGLYWVIERV